VDKTFVPKGQQESGWVLVDATDAPIGRLATQIAAVLLGKNKPIYTPGFETGDFVVVINAGRLNVPVKRQETKFYHHHSGYPGGLKTVSLRDQLIYNPDRVIRAAVWGMLPHNKYGRKLIKKLKVYGGSEHPHAAQNPKPLA